MKLSLVLPSFLAASGIFASVVGAEKAPASTGGLRANSNQGERKTNEVTSDYWIAPIKNVGLKCIDNSIRAGGGKPNEICMTEGEALCIEYDYKPMGGRWQFGIKDSKLRLYDPKQEVVYEYGTDVSHVCIGEEQGFDPNRYSKERPYMTLYNEKTHKVVGSLTCDGTDGKDDENIGQSTMLKLVDQADIGPYASYPLTIVKFKKGQTEDPKDDNSLWNIVVGDYPTDQPTDEPTMEPTPEPTDTFSPTITAFPTEFPTLTPEPTDFPTAEPTFAPTGELSALYGLVNFNAHKCEWIAFVDTFQELHRRIAMATDRNNPAKIEISNIRPIVFEDIIDISNKYFEISCPDSNCVFDLNGYSFVTPDNGPGSPFKVEFDGMTMRNGSSRKGRDDDTYNTVYGGAFMVRGVSPDVSSLVLNDSIFRNNFAVSDSGVIDNIGASITATGCTFEDNESSDGNGGAIYSDGDSTFKRCRFEGNYAEYSGGALYLIGDLKATITDCDFDDNTADSYDGGAIWLGEETKVLVTGCSFTANSGGDWGGALRSSGNTEIHNCNFEDNEAVLGGALYFASGGVANVGGTTFAKNSGLDDGGAVYAFEATVIFDGCNYVENSANGWGGAVIAFEASVDFLACEFEKNNAINKGGAVFIEGGSSTSTFNNCHFSENNSFEGGAMSLSFGAETNIDGCRFDGNSAFGAGAILTSDAETEIVGGTEFECNTAIVAGGMAQLSGNVDISGAKFINNEAFFVGALYIDSADSSIDNSLFDQNAAIFDEAGAIAYFDAFGDNTISSTVFQNNTSPLASNDILSQQAIQCGAGYGNCFCDADASPHVAPNITTNDLPSTCSGSNVGFCSGCLPTSSSTCSSTSRADLMTRTGSDSFEKMDMNDVHAMFEDKMKSMGEKMGAMKQKMGEAMKSKAEKEVEKKAAMKK